MFLKQVFKVVRIAAVWSFIFASLRLYYINYLIMIYNITV